MSISMHVFCKQTDRKIEVVRSIFDCVWSRLEIGDLVNQPCKVPTSSSKPERPLYLSKQTQDSPGNRQLDTAHGVQWAAIRNSIGILSRLQGSDHWDLHRLWVQGLRAQCKFYADLESEEEVENDYISVSTTVEERNYQSVHGWKISQHQNTRRLGINEEAPGPRTAPMDRRQGFNQNFVCISTFLGVDICHGGHIEPEGYGDYKERRGILLQMALWDPFLKLCRSQWPIPASPIAPG